MQMIVVLVILIGAIVLFVTEKLRVDVVALLVVVSLMGLQILTPAEALAGFSNSAVVMIAALFVIGGAVMQTGLADMIGRRILSAAGKEERRLIIILMLAVALMSSVMSDTGTVAVLLPAVIVLARNADIAPSKLLIPLAFGSLLGGAMTLIGTPPNIIVSDLLRENGLVAFQFFSYTPMGLILLALGVLFMVGFGRNLLPNHVGDKPVSARDDQMRVITEYHLDDDMSRLRVRQGSPLVGLDVRSADLRRRYDLDLLKIMRPPEPRPALRLGGIVRNGDTPRRKSTAIIPDANTVIALDDVLIVLGDQEQVRRAAIDNRLGIQPLSPKDNKALVGREVGTAEVVIPRRSHQIDKTLTETRFFDLHRVNVLSILKPNGDLLDDVRDVVIGFGDVLLVHGTWENLLALKQQPRDFILIGQPETMVGAPNQHKAGWALTILLSMIVFMVAGWLPVLTTILIAAGLMVLVGCLTMDEAYGSIDWKSVILIAGMIPMSTALENVGVVDAMAVGMVETLGRFGPVVVLGGLFLLTTFFTQFLSNTATVVIISSIALTTATELGVQPHAFLMGVAIAGSMAFASPVASPVNTLVMGAGGYRFSDYLKVGMPLILIAFVATLLVLPLLFPF